MLYNLTGVAAMAALPAAARAAAGAAQGPLPHSSAMAAGNFVPAPAAWFTLLRQFPDLDPATATFEPARLTVGRAAQIIKVNKEVNAAIRYRDDADKDFWEVGGSEGDCEDFAIRKLQDLVGHYGFPRGALTLAACRLDHARGHAVLLVHSDKGVYVMDNLTPRVLPWRKLPYRWVAREEPGAPFRLWRALA
jgi:predicted transglutaminase-like cysteine proteinase